MQFDLITDTVALCRLCMTTKEGCRTNLYDSASFAAEGQPSLHGMLKSICAQVFSNAEADDPPGMPKDVCASCRSSTVAAYELHQMCVETDRRLGELLALQWELQGPDRGDPQEDSNNDETFETAEEKPLPFSDQLIQSLGDEKVNDPLSNNDQLDMIKDEPLDLIEEIEADYQNSYSKPEAYMGMTDIKSTKLHVCVICDRYFKKASALKVHISLCHKNLLNSKEIFECNLCGQTFKSLGKYRYHRNKHGGNYICPCGKPFGTIGSFNTHIRSGACTGDQSTRCEECDKEFPSVYAITNHRRLKHSGPDNTAHVETSLADNNKCEECDTTFPSAVAFDDHRRSVHSGRIVTVHHQQTMHETKKLHSTDEIEEDSTTQQEADTAAAENEEDGHDSQREIDMELDETKPGKIYECEICGQTFKSLGRYRYHKNKHGGNYICPCGKPFGTIGSFNRHIRTGACTGDQSTKCEECDQEFPSVYAITNHRRLKHSESEKMAQIQHKCEQCDRIFPSAYAFAVHRRSVHSGRIDTVHKQTKQETKKQILIDKNEEDCHASDFQQEIDMEADDTKLINQHECEICYKSFKKASALKAHCSLRHKNLLASNKMFMCELCGQTFKSHGRYRYHKNKHGGNYICPCGKPFGTIRSFNTHIKNGACTGDLSTKCEECDKDFPSVYAITNHRRLEHSGPDRRAHIETGSAENNKCEECDKVFPTAYAIAFHRRLVHSGISNAKDAGEEVQIFNCDICGNKFIDEHQLNRHKRMKHGFNVLYKCSICNKTFDSSRAKGNHSKTHKGPFKCHVCGKLLRTRASFKGHMLRHEGIKPFACKICPMRFYTSAEINEHKLTHTKSKNHTCEICGSRFSKSFSLKKHVRFVHEGQRPCECHVCGFKCSITSQLKRHLLTHTGEKPFKCGSCDQAYAQSNDLVKHVARVHGLDKPYQCDRCDESFRLLTDLRQHYRVHAQPGDGSEQVEEVRFTSIAILQRAFAKDKQQQVEKESQR